MFEKFLSVKKLNISEKSVWNKLYELNEKACEGKLVYKLRPKDKYGIDDIYNYGLVETKDRKNPLEIVLVKFNNDSIFLDSFDVTKTCEDRVSLNNLTGALRKTYKANVLFVLELDNKEKFKLCYHPLQFNKNNIKAGLASYAQVNYSYVNVSITPWIHLDAQSRTIKTALAKLNDLFEQASKMKTDEFFPKLEKIIKEISSDNIISVLTKTPISEEFSLSPKRLFAGLDVFDASYCMSHFNLEKTLLETIPTISVKGSFHDVYEKVDVEDFWHLIHSNGVEEDDLTECPCFENDTSLESVVTTEDENPTIENNIQNKEDSNIKFMVCNKCLYYYTLEGNSGKSEKILGLSNILKSICGKFSNEKCPKCLSEDVSICTPEELTHIKHIRLT